MSGQFEEDPGRVQIWGILSAPGPKVRDKDGEYFRKVQKETRRSAHSKSVVGTKQHNTGASEVFHHERRKMWFSARGLWKRTFKSVLCSQIDQSIRRKLSRIPCREMVCTTHSNASLSFVAGGEEGAEV
jgi:hypothetical protein